MFQKNLNLCGGERVNTSTKVKNLVRDRGLRQTWIVEQMNSIAPELNMSKTKFSAIICGGRKMSGDELIAFCVATGTDPNYFCEAAQDTA